MDKLQFETSYKVLYSQGFTFLRAYWQDCGTLHYAAT